MRRRRNFFKILLLISLLSLVVVFVLKTDFFSIDTIEVEGNFKLDNKSIVDRSKIYIGENIFKIKLSEAENRIRNLPYIKESEVKRKFPKTIIIDVIEREAAFLVENISMFFLVDVDGNILELLKDNETDLPIISGLEVEDRKLGNNIFDNYENEQLKEFFLESKDKGLLDKMENIDMTLLEEINITLINGISVAFGTLNNVKYRVSLLMKVLEDIEENEIPCSKIIMDRGSHPIIITDN